MKRIKPKIKSIKVKGLKNTRDLSSLSDLSGLNIKSKIIFRSGRIDKVSEKRRNKFFQDNNITKVIDLRNEVEISEARTIRFPENVQNVKLPILSKAFFGITHEKKMSKALTVDSVKKASTVGEDKYLTSMYQDILTNVESQQLIRQLFQIIIDSNEGAVLYHCQTGKDRTGIVSMLILNILGVDEETIIEDYMASQYFNRKYIKSRLFLLSIAFFIKKDLRRLLVQMLGAKKEYMRDTINFIKYKYGSIEDYLINIIKLTKEDLLKIREKLLNR